MKIRMLTTMAGPAGVFLAGQVADFEDGHALALIKAGYAEPVAPPKKVAMETAVLPQPETTSRPAPQPRHAPLPEVVGDYADDLARLGIETAQALLEADSQVLTGLSGVGPATARRWKAAAQEMLDAD